MRELVRFVQRRFRALSDPRKAGPMAAYMRTDMPFYGVQKPARVAVLRAARQKFPIETRSQYNAAVLGLWKLAHREEKYAAIWIAQQFDLFIVPASLPLYRRLIVEGAWWDFVDNVAIRLTGAVWLNHRARLSRVMDRWIDEENMWLRRAAIIGQIKHKDATDRQRLFDYCLRRCDEKEFFIRKAIGWALREYAYTAPDAVRQFLREHRAQLSPLSFREAAKHLRLPTRVR
jgi:3-methyladenine DNA glycosylase AlkD